MSVADVLVPLALGVVANEAIDVCPWLAGKLVRWSARRITDPVVAKRYEEEWLAGLEDRPGKLLKLLSAASIVVGASWRMREIFRTADSGDEMKRHTGRGSSLQKRRAFPALLGLPRLYWGYVTFPTAVAEWITGGSWVLILTLALVSVLYFAFQAPVTCGAPVRGRQDGCRNNGSGILLGCHIRQHRWQKLKMLTMRRRTWEFCTGLFSDGKATLVTLGGAASLVSTLVGVLHAV